MLRLTRASIALGIWVALVFQLAVTLDRGGSAVNFVSFFTILSNVAAFVLMIVQAVRRANAPPSLRGAVALYMAVTGLIHAVLLAPITADVGLTEPWVDFILHIAGPVAVVADWFVFPPEARPTAKAALAWLIFPAVYLGYSLIRGPRAEWYPYPFLDPGENGGYGGVAVYSVVILVVFLGIAWVLRRTGPPSGSRAAPA